MTKKTKRTALISALVAIVLIQLVPVDRTNPPVIADFDGPQEVKDILVRSCYDCHSNESNWPWYSYVAPVSWLVAHDVEEGREELNFSNWPAFKDDAHLIEEIYEETEKGEMPMELYLFTHSAAKLSDEELAILKKWTDGYGK